MVKGKLQLAAAGGLHPGKGTRQDDVIAEVDVVEHRGIAFKIASVIHRLEFKRDFKL
ncbi:hypothetical protein D3C84_1258980 [compost metagenome]